MSIDSIDELRRHLDYIESVVKDLPVEEQRRIAHPEYFLGSPYKLYYRAPNRDSVEYKILREIIGRDTDMLYPQFGSWEKRWYDEDVDRELWGYDFTYLGREEYKYTYKLEQPFRYPDCREGSRHESGCEDCRELEAVACEEVKEHLLYCGACKFRKYLSSTLARSSLWIRGSVKNFSCDSPVDRGYEDGKGVVLYKFYSADLQCFSIINFTGEDYNNINPVKLLVVGNRIQPWASELMNFLVEAWIRRKYEDATNHIKRGLEYKEFSFNAGIDEFLVSTVDTWENRVKRQLWIEVIMDEIMERVSYNTVLNEPERYLGFVEGIKRGELVLDCLKVEPKRIKLRA